MKRYSKIFFTILLIYCLTVCALAIGAAAETEDKAVSYGTLVETFNLENDDTANLYKSVDEYTLVISGTGDMKALTKDTIPWSAYSSKITKAVVEDGITKVGAYCFYQHTALKEVRIAESVTSTGTNIFNGCTGGLTIYLPKSITTIGSSSFSNCSGLIIKYAGSIADWCTIEYNASSATPLNYAAEFHINNELVTDLVIPESVETVGQYCFYGYENFKSIEIFAGTEISANAFKNTATKSKLESITVNMSSTGSTTLDFATKTLLTDMTSRTDISRRIVADGMTVELSISDLLNNVTAGTTVFSSSFNQSRDGATVTSTYSFNIQDNGADVFNNDNPCTANITYSFNPGLKNVSVTYGGVLLKDGYTYDSETGTVTLSATTLGECVISGEKDAPVISGVGLNLNEDIDVIYLATAPEGYEVSHMTFTFGGKEYTVSDYTAKGGAYEFRFKGIMPYQMGDNISATLVSTDAGGETYEYTHGTMSVRYYYELAIKNAPNDKELLTLLSDMLVYGEKAQLYREYKMDTLVTEGLTLTASEYVKPESVFKTVEDSEDRAKWTGAGLYCADNMGMYFTLTANESEHLTVRISIGKRSKTYELSELTKNDDGKYELLYTGIMAYEFAETVTAEVLIDGAAICSASYSVNSYINRNDSDANTSLSNLVKSIWCYGNSAVAYMNKVEVI